MYTGTWKEEKAREADLGPAQLLGDGHGEGDGGVEVAAGHPARDEDADHEGETVAKAHVEEGAALKMPLGPPIIQHCTALHCTALRCIALHCTALHCTDAGTELGL
jgi:hypothetical protein